MVVAGDSEWSAETVASVAAMRSRRKRSRLRGRATLLAAGVLVLGIVLGNGSSAAAQGAPKPHLDTLVVGRPRTVVSGEDVPSAAGFLRLTGAAPLSGGLLVVADDGHVQLSVFDLAGRFVRAVGRKGRGPGEYRGVDAIQVRRDTIVVIDGRTAIHLYHASGRWLLSRRLPTVEGYLTNPALGLLGPSQFLLRMKSVTAPPTSGTVVDDSIQMWLWDGATKPHPLVTVPVARISRHPTARAHYMTLFSPFTTYAFRGNELCYSYPRRYQVRCLAANGEVADVVTEQRVAANVTPREVAAARRVLAGYDASGRSKYAESSLRAHRERVASRAAAESRHPVMGGILVASDGAIWVRQYTPDMGVAEQAGRFADSPSTWVEYGSDGKQKSAFRVPPRHWVTAIDGRRIIAVVRDGDDVEAVRVYELGR